MRPSTILLIALFSFIPHASAKVPCATSDYSCFFNLIEQRAEQITESRWRNQAYRDLAVSKAMDGHYDGAVALIDKIDNPDTQAMTVRAIGMAVALHKDLDNTTYRAIFAKLDTKSATIKDSGAKDIAYTYIAMAQAFAGLDDDATKTTDNMTNPALKHKAFGETAEIQAERGDYDQAMKSINAIDSIAFKNKALGIISGIFVKREEYERAQRAALNITNMTKQVSALQNILNAHQGLDKK